MKFFTASLCIALLTLNINALALPVTFFPGIGLGQREIFIGCNEERIVTGEAFPTPANAEVIAHQQNILLTYGLLPELFAIGVIPFNEFHQNITMSGERVVRKSRGIGDVFAGLTWRPFTFNGIGTTSRVLVTLGAQAPTGNFGESDSFGVLPRNLQPGTGNWTIPVQAYFIFQKLKTELVGGVLYNMRIGGHGYRFGDNATFVFAWNPTILPWKLPRKGYYSTLILNFEVDFIWAQRNIQNGTPVLNTGGHAITFIPGLRYNHKYFTLAIAYTHPVRTKLNGGPGLPAQLVPKPWRSWSIALGVRY